MKGEERIKHQPRLAGWGTGTQGGWGPATCREPHTPLPPDAPWLCPLLYLKAPGGDVSSQ